MNATFTNVTASSVPVMPAWSSYAGEEFNLTERRPLRIRTETDEAFHVDDFYHRAQFWQAVIPKSGVQEIVAQRLNFSQPRKQKDGSTKPKFFFLNHVQARLKMRADRAIRLYPADSETTGQPALEIRDFTYSVEAVGPFGRRWNLSDALLGNLAIVHRFLSTQEVTFERIMRERMKIFQSPPLPLQTELLDTMLQEAIRESHGAGLTRPYFMFRLPFTAANCTSEPLRLLDDVLHTPVQRRFFHRLPLYPRGYLKLRGLWQEGQTIPTLNEEMADWLTSDEAKERRQIHVRLKKEIPKATAAKVSWWKNLARFPKAVRSDARSGA